jgi:hypothetical protein
MHAPSVRSAGRIRATCPALLVVAAVALAACSSSSAAPTTDPNALSSGLANEFVTILQQPAADKADQLKTFLAPEFQIVRANGDQVGRDACLQKPASVKTYCVTDVKATQAGDVLIEGYRITIDEPINGVAQSTTTSCLSVFHWTDGAWHLAAHRKVGALTK